MNLKRILLAGSMAWAAISGYAHPGHEENPTQLFAALETDSSRIVMPSTIDTAGMRYVVDAARVLP